MTALVALALTGCEAPVSEAVAPATDAIKGGAPDSDHTGVVAVESTTELCSGYLIAPTLVLTARHCTSTVISGTQTCLSEAADAGGTPSTCGPALPTGDLQVFDVPDVNVATAAAILPVAKVINLPGSEGTPMCGYDVSLVQLTKPIPGAKPIDPRLDLPPLLGESFTAVGYGLDGAKPNTAGVRRSIDGLTVDHVGDGPVQSANLDRPTANDWNADRGPCGGDSGSPALDAAGRAIGVMSRGQASVCTNMIYTQVAPFADWLRSTAEQVAKETGTAAPAWTTKPADASASLGDDCSSATQCKAGLSCLPLGDRFRCTSTDCEMCPAGWMCGASLGKPACVETVAPQDATPDASTTSPAPAETPPASSGCSAAPGRASALGGALVVALVVLFSRRRRPAPNTP